MILDHDRGCALISAGSLHQSSRRLSARSFLANELYQELSHHRQIRRLWLIKAGFFQLPQKMRTTRARRAPRHRTLRHELELRSAHASLDLHIQEWLQAYEARNHVLLNSLPRLWLSQTRSKTRPKKPARCWRPCYAVPCSGRDG